MALIDRQETLDLFDQLMQSQGELRIMRLIGEAKFGKTHFVAKVFPELAKREFQAKCCVIDLRDKTQEIGDVLHNMYRMLGGESLFPNYYLAYREWQHRPRVNLQGIRSFFSSIKITLSDSADEQRFVIRYLTDAFAKDLQNLNQNPVVLLFDAVERADEYTQAWLIDNLLMQLAQIDHVRIVLAGRSIPEPAGNYAMNCCSYELSSIHDEEAFILYCNQIGVSLEEQSIRDIANVVDYNPGLFVDSVIPKFTDNR